jgi:hypothetical protein
VCYLKKFHRRFDYRSKKIPDLTGISDKKNNYGHMELVFLSSQQYHVPRRYSGHITLPLNVVVFHSILTFETFVPLKY